jgi:hypothetical protein
MQNPQLQNPQGAQYGVSLALIGYCKENNWTFFTSLDFIIFGTCDQYLLFIFKWLNWHMHVLQVQQMPQVSMQNPMMTQQQANMVVRSHNHANI